MSRGSRVLWSTVGVFLVIGVICIIFGMMNDATLDTVNVPLNFIKGGVDIDINDFDEDDFVALEEWDADSVDSIECKADCMGLLIRKAEGKTGSVYVQKNKRDEVEFDISNGNLFLSDDIDVTIFGITKGVKVILEIPEKVYDNLIVEIDAGLVQLSSVQADNMEFAIDAGSLVAKEALSGEDINVTVDAGHANIEELQLTGEAVLEVAVGNIEVDKMDVRRLTASCEVGNLDLKGINAKNTSASCEVGNIDLHFDGHSDEYDVTTSSEIGNIDVHYSNSNAGGIEESKSIELECEVGNIDVKFEQ